MAHAKPTTASIKPAAKRLTRATTAPVAAGLGTITLPPSITTPTPSTPPPATIAGPPAPIVPPPGDSGNTHPVRVPAPTPLGDLFGSAQAIANATPVLQGDPIAPALNAPFNPATSISESPFLQDLRSLVDGIGPTGPNVAVPTSEAPPTDAGDSISSAKGKQTQKPPSPVPGPSQPHSIPDTPEYFKRQMIGDGVHKTNKKDLQVLIDQIVGHVATEHSLNRARHHEIMDLLENHGAQILNLASEPPTASDGSVALDVGYNDMVASVQDLQGNMSSAVVHITNLNVRFTRLESLLTSVLASLGQAHPTLSTPATPMATTSTPQPAPMLQPAMAPPAVVALDSTHFAHSSSPPLMVGSASTVSSPPILGGSAQPAQPPRLGPSPAAPAAVPPPKKQKRDFKAPPGSVVVTISNVAWMTDVTGGVRATVNKVMGSAADPVLMRSSFRAWRSPLEALIPWAKFVVADAQQLAWAQWFCKTWNVSIPGTQWESSNATYEEVPLN